VPAPETWVMLSGGLAVIGALRAVRWQSR
jgi:hypothetical protein